MVIPAPDGVWTEQVVAIVTQGYSGTLANLVQVTIDEGATGVYTKTSIVIGVTGGYSCQLPTVWGNSLAACPNSRSVLGRRWVGDRPADHSGTDRAYRAA